MGLEEILSIVIPLAIKYGPAVIEDIKPLFQPQDHVTLDQIKAAFAKVKPYDSYGIPAAPVVKP